MKRFVFSALFFALLASGFAQQEAATLPSVNLKTLDGKKFNTADISNDGKPIIICFFATWCKPCMVELKTIAESYEEWQEETGVKIYAVSIDDSLVPRPDIVCHVDRRNRRGGVAVQNHTQPVVQSIFLKRNHLNPPSIGRLTP